VKSPLRLTTNNFIYFTVSDSRLPQPGGPGPRIYIPQGQDYPVIPPGTGFPFRYILGLAGLGGGTRTRLHMCLPNDWTHQNWINYYQLAAVFVIEPRGWPNRKHRFHRYSPTIPWLLLACSLQRERVYRAVARQWTSTLSMLFRLSGVMSHYTARWSTDSPEQLLVSKPVKKIQTAQKNYIHNV
jgi:hypothetical protein